MMRRPTARASGRDVAVHGFSRRRRAVANDRGRAVVAATEGDARDVELGATVRFEVLARTLARLGARSGLVLYLGHGLEIAERFGEAPGVRRIAFGERLALD